MNLKSNTFFRWYIHPCIWFATILVRWEFLWTYLLRFFLSLRWQSLMLGWWLFRTFLANLHFFLSSFHWFRWRQEDWRWLIRPFFWSFLSPSSCKHMALWRLQWWTCPKKELIVSLWQKVPSRTLRRLIWEWCTILPMMKFWIRLDAQDWGVLFTYLVILGYQFSGFEDYRMTMGRCYFYCIGRIVWYLVGWFFWRRVWVWDIRSQLRLRSTRQVGTG